MYATRRFAIVTGASTGIGFELARRCAQEGYDLLIAADEPEIEKAAASLRHGATETEFFRRADMMDTEVGTSEKDDAAEVANNGFDAMMKGEGDTVTGFKNKVQSAAANVMPAGVLARQHRKKAESGSANK